MDKNYAELEEAVQTFVASQEGGDLSGWILSFQTSVITTNPDYMAVGYGNSFVVGEATSPVLAIGLLKVSGSSLMQFIDGPDE